MVAKLHDCIKKHRSVCFKWVNCVAWELYLIESVKNQCIKMMMIKVIIFHMVVLVCMWLWSERYLFLRSQWFAWELFLLACQEYTATVGS